MGPEVERTMEATTDGSTQERSFPLEADTLTGDIRDVLLTHIRSMETPWSKLSEFQQGDKIRAISKCAEDLVRRSITIVASQDFPRLEVKPGKWSVKEGHIDLALSTMGSVENIMKLAEHHEGRALLVLVDPGEFFGERRAARAEPDQRAMKLDPDECEEDAESGAETEPGASEGEGEAGAEVPQPDSDAPVAEGGDSEAVAAPATEPEASKSTRRRKRLTIQEMEPA